MADPSSWRSSASAEHYTEHDFADFAQEFLRRNGDYRREWDDAEKSAATILESPPDTPEDLSSRWGLCLPICPDLSPRQAPALWLPQNAAAIVTLESPVEPAAFELPASARMLADRLIGGERHLVLETALHRVRLCIRRAAGRKITMIVIPMDGLAGKRLAAARTAERLLCGHGEGAHNSALPTRYQRGRFILMLAVHDALTDGATIHDVAFTLAFPRTKPLTGAEWKGSGERRHTLRLIADARRMVTTGYRMLLRH